MSNATSTQLQELYVAYFGRAADPTGLDYWTEKGISTAAFAANMYAQPEFKSAYGSLSTESQVNQIYKNLFDREADVAGLTYWTQQIKLGNLQLAEIANHLVWAAQNNSGSEDDKTALTNRTNAAVAYTAKVKESTAGILAYQALNNGLGTEDFAAGLNITEAKSYLSGIDKDTAHTTAGVASSVASIVTNGVPSVSLGKTFTLTTNTDTFAGTSGKDVFQGVFVGNAATGTTIKSGDSTVGGEGVDTLNISVTGASGAAQSIEGINADVEKILFSNYDTDTTQNRTHTFNASLADGVTTVGLSSSNDNGDTLFTNLKNIVSAEMFNGSSDLSISHIDSATKGDADAGTLTLSGAIKGASVVPTFTETAGSAAGGLETLTVTSQGSANNVNITSGQNSLETVNINGDQNLTTTLTSSALKTVNASSFTGKLDVTHGVANDLTITGGSGDDTITFSGNNFTSSDTIDGGAGTDVLVINSPVTAATLLKKVSNVETLKFLAASTHDVTLAADANVMNFDFTSTGSNLLTLNTGVAGDVSVTFGITGADQVNNAANVPLTVKGSATAIETSTLITGGSKTDVIEITADTEADAAINITTQNVTKVETITVVDGGDATTGSTKLSGKDINLTTGAYATALTIDGSALDAANKDNDSDGDIDNSDTSAEKLTVDGSSATGKLTITGGGAGDSITGGTKDDTIDGGAGDDTITLTAGGKDNVKGGAGKDKFVFGSTLTKDDVVDGGDGVDTLSVTTLTAANLAGVTNVETLAFTGTAVLTKDLSFDTIDLTDGSVADKVTFSTGYTKATTVKVEDGDTAVNSAKIAMTVSGNAANFEGADSTTITGSSSTKNDSLVLTASGADTADTVATSGLITNVNTITVVDAGDATTGSTGLSGSDFSIDLTSYNTALTIDASALDAANKDNGGDGKISSADASEEKLLIAGTASKALTVTGGEGTDTIVGSTAIDTLKGNGGADTFTLAGNLTYEDTIDGGAGTDILTISSALNDVDFMKVSNVETLDLDPATTNARAIALGSYFSASGITTVKLNDGAVSTVTATGTTTGVTYTATGARDESVTAGVGDDTFVFNATGTLTVDDTINGGSGTDTIQIDNSAGAVSATIGVAEVTNIEKVVIKDPDSGDTAGSENEDLQSITFNGESGIYDAADTTDETDVSLEVDASVITDSKDKVTIDASDIGDSDFTFTIKGGAAIDTLKGGGGADTINGNGGADVITGNAGADTIDGGAGDDDIAGGAGQDALTGGDGKDDFNFTFGNSDSTQAKPDTIADFTTGSDEVRFSLTAPAGATVYDFTNKGSASSVADGIGLLSGTGSSPLGQYIFNTTTNQVLMDIDGNGLLQSGDTAITMTGVSSLADADVAFDVITAGTADTVTTGKGNDTVDAQVLGDIIDTGAGDDTVTLNALTYTNAGGTLKLGTGTGDTIAVAADAVTTALTISGVEKVTLVADADFTISEATAANFVAIDGFSITGVVSGAETENILVKPLGGTAGATTLDISGITYTGINTTNILLDNASDDLKTPANTNDTFDYDGTFTNFTAATKIDGGAGGTDVLDINSATALTIALGTVTGIETLDLISASDITMTNAQLGGFATIKGDGGGTAGDVIVAVDGGITALDVSAATHTAITTNNSIDNNADVMKMATAGTVVDTFVIPVATTITATAAFNITGGGGTDVLDINAVGATHPTDLRLGTIATVETLNLDSGGVDTVVSLTGAQFAGFTTITAAATDKINVTTMQDITLTASAGIDTITVADGETGFSIASFSQAAGGGETDVLNLDATVNGSVYSELTAAAAIDTGDVGLVIFDKSEASVALSGNGMTAVEAASILLSGTGNIAAGEKTIAAVTTDLTNAANLNFYLLTVNSGADGFDTPVLLGTLSGVGDVTAFTDANFAGFAAA